MPLHHLVLTIAGYYSLLYVYTLVWALFTISPISGAVLLIRSFSRTA